MERSEINQGLDVYSSDGKKVGTVAAVLDTGHTEDNPQPSTSTEVREAQVRAEDKAVDSWPLTDTTASYGALDTGIGRNIGATGSAEGADDALTDVTGSGNGTYVQVDHGGLLGIGAQHLYIPLNDVERSGDRLTVNCVSDHCGDRYGEKPPSLDSPAYDIV